MMRIFFIILLFCCSCLLPAQQCNIAPNTMEHIVQWEVRSQRMFSVDDKTSKKHLETEFEFYPDGECRKYMYREANRNQYHVHHYENNGRGSYSSLTFSYKPALDSQEIMIDKTETYIDTLCNRLGLTVRYHQHKRGVYMKTITLPVYNEKGEFVHQEMFQLWNEGDTFKKDYFVRTEKTLSHIVAEKINGKWVEKNKTLTTYDKNKRVESIKEYKDGKLTDESLHTYVLDGERVKEETIKTGKGKLKQVKTYRYDAPVGLVENIDDYDKTGKLIRRTTYTPKGFTILVYHNGNIINSEEHLYPESDPVEQPEVEKKNPVEKPACKGMNTKQLLGLKQAKRLKKRYEETEKPQPKQGFTQEHYADPVNKQGLTMTEKYNDKGLIIDRVVKADGRHFVWEYGFFK